MNKARRTKLENLLERFAEINMVERINEIEDWLNEVIN